MNDLCGNCGLRRFDHVHSRLRGYVCPGGRGKYKSLAVQKVLDQRREARNQRNADTK